MYRPTISRLQRIGTAGWRWVEWTPARGVRYLETGADGCGLYRLLPGAPVPGGPVRPQPRPMERVLLDAGARFPRSRSGADQAARRLAEGK